MLGILLTIMSCISGIIGIGLITVNILYEHFSTETEAEIIRTESRLKSFDSTVRKQTAYDYVYEYADTDNKKYTGKIIKNSPIQEFSEGDKIFVRYINKCPSFSLYQKFSTLPYVVLTMSILLYAIKIFTLWKEW